jgi:L-threonylcarbamoyladenylate synthase
LMPVLMPDGDGVESLLLQLQSGNPVLIPTDTLPALAALPDHARQIWCLKQRPLEKPLILMGADAMDLLCHARVDARREAEALASDHWPGALTLVLPSQGSMTDRLHPGASTLGMRVPYCAVTRALLARSGPLATTSVNRSGEPAATNARDAWRCFPSLSLLAPLPWPAPSGLASTVLAWSGPGEWRVLREGAVMPTGLNLKPPCSG